MGTVAVSSFGFIGGASRDRTGDLLHAMQALSQLSYGPTAGKPASLGAVPGSVNHFFTLETKTGCAPLRTDSFFDDERALHDRRVPGEGAEKRVIATDLELAAGE